MSSSQIRVRFAPSPTGFLHVGGVRTLLFNWLYAKRNQGTLVLRVEDTDLQRSTRQNEEMLLEDIRQLGLDYQEGPAPVGGPHEPYRQSERFLIYAQHAKKLLDEGKAYYCFCSPELLTQKNEASLKMGRTPIYDGACLRIPPHEAKERVMKGERAGLRFKAPHSSVFLKDLVRGEIEFREGTIGDFLISRSPQPGEKESLSGIGMPVYNFCCVMDDHLMGMTQVIRGDDHLSNTARQMMLYAAFGWTPPQFAHISMVLGADKQKLSKRNGDVSVRDYLTKGYLKEALLNFLALLGWWPAQGYQTKSKHPEILSLEELTQLFHTDGLQKSAAVFDVQKLNWMNAFYIKMLSAEEIATRAKPFFDELASDGLKQLIQNHKPDWFVKVIDCVRGEATLLADLVRSAEFFVDAQFKVEDEVKTLLQDSAQKAVAQFCLTQIEAGTSENMTTEEIDQIQQQALQTLQAKGKAFFMPFRAVTQGTLKGPELKKALPLLSRQSVITRGKAVLQSF